MREYFKSYRKSEKYKEYHKKYMSSYKHTDKYKAQRKTYSESEKRKEYLKKYHEESEKYKEYQRKYQNSPKFKEKRKLESHKEYQNNYNKNYEKTPESKKKFTDYVRNRRTNDVQFKLTTLLRHRLYMALKSNSKTGSAVHDLGCTVEELKKYLESKFQQGMSWDNHGKWHIDHILPLSSFNLSDREQLIKACHFTNLQPLWAEENMKKGSTPPSDDAHNLTLFLQMVQ